MRFLFLHFYRTMMTYKNRVTLFMLIGVLLVFSASCRRASYMVVTSDGCCYVYDQIPAPQSLKTLKGKLVGERYYDPAGLFSIEVPSQYHNRIIEKSDPKGRCSTIGFNNIADEVLIVHAGAFDDELFAELHLRHGVSGATQRNILSHYLKPIQKPFPTLEIVEERVIDNDGDHACFAFASVPNGSSSYDSHTKIHLDDERGYLTFFADDQTVVISLDLPIYRSRNEDKKEWLLEELYQLRRTYRNERSKADPEVLEIPTRSQESL